MKTYKNVDAYIRGAGERASVLSRVRAVVMKAAPSAVERIAYGMPSYDYKGKPLFYFAAMKGHLGLYPTPGPIVTLKSELSGYSTSKGCVRVPYTAALPSALITKLVKARMKEIVLELKESKT